MNIHRYTTELEWTGNAGSGTQSYRSYSRSFEIACELKPKLHGSSDKAFRGDPARYNPEELLVAALSSCHMLSYLHLCAVNGVVVQEYTDSAEGYLYEERGSGAFSAVELRPRVTISIESDPQKAASLHEDAHRECFIAKSVNFAVNVKPEIIQRTT
jgi:organic hydroperoxide reductase OsmC/OhrA